LEFDHNFVIGCSNKLEFEALAVFELEEDKLGLSVLVALHWLTFDFWLQQFGPGMRFNVAASFVQIGYDAGVF
jgi:hypothetical protein